MKFLISKVESVNMLKRKNQKEKRDFFFLKTIWSLHGAFIFLQLIPVWIRDNKQPINGGLNWEMEFESAAKFNGWRRLITPLLSALFFSHLKS